MRAFWEKQLYEIGFCFFRWLLCWGYLIEGFIGVLTGGVWIPFLGPAAEKWFLDYYESNKRPARTAQLGRLEK